MKGNYILHLGDWGFNSPRP